MTQFPSPAASEIALLGGFRLMICGEDNDILPRKARALLAYLVMQDGRVISRETAADLLWTDRGTEQARHSLRQTLLVLRRELEPLGQEVLRTEHSALSIVPNTLQSDIGQLRRLFASTNRDDLAQGALLYAGPLLDGFPPISAEFDAWLLRTREHTADFALNMLARLADACAAAGEPHEAVSVTERMVALDPLREDVHRRLMTAYLQAGRRGDAIRQYELCAETLRQELDVTPSAETDALLQSIRFGTGVRAGSPLLNSVEPRAGGVARTDDGPPWIMVLPFRRQLADDQSEWFTEGVIEGIIHILSGIENLSVIARGTSLTYAARAVDPRTVGQEIGVRYVLSGSVWRANERLRINTELADATSGKVLRSDIHDGAVGELFDMQDQIAREVVWAIAPTVREYELERAMRKHPDSRTGYDLLLQGIHLLYELQKDSYGRARDLLVEAITHDPTFAPPYSYAATWHMLHIGQGWSARIIDDAAEAARFAAAAIERDRNDAVALAIHGQMLSFTQRDYRAALHFLDRAIAVGPSCHMAWTLSSTTAGWTGDGARAVAHAERALRLSPRDPFAFFAEHMLSQGHYISGNYEEAVVWGRKAAAHNGLLTSNLRTLAAALVAVGDIPAAREVARQVLAIEPAFRLQTFAMRSPMKPEILKFHVPRLRQAGLPD
jgi:DNA-binding SARP family transcriptional activator/Tfp pilus assembly protein PilF